MEMENRKMSIIAVRPFDKRKKSIFTKNSSGSSGNNNVEILARNLADVNFKFTWKIENYLKSVDEGQDMDSPPFEFNVNGIQTKWSLALRFWSDEEGGRLSNPIVICLNLLGYKCEEEEQIEIRHQFGILNTIVKRYEICPFTKQKIELKEAKLAINGLLSIGYRDVLILDRHLIAGGAVELFCKIIVLRSKVEQHTLGLDLWNKLKTSELCDVTLRSSECDNFPAHKTILGARSPVLARMISRGDSILNVPIPSSILKSFLQYIYTDHVDPLDNPQGLLKLACKYELPGLKNICESALIDSITQLNVASILLLADTFDCDELKKAGLAYCEENSGSIVKTLAWKVMEHLNPELFDEVCRN